MNKLTRVFLIGVVCLLIGVGAACKESEEEEREREGKEKFPSYGKVIEPPTDANDSERMLTIRALEQRVKQDPDDFIASNKLANYYLQLQRETGNTQL